MISLAVPLAAMLTTTVVADGSHYTRKANAVFSGIGPAIITPMNADGTEINLEPVPALVESFIEAGVGGVYATGSTGAGFLLTMEQRKQMTEAVVKAVAGRVPVIVMVGACPLEEAKELAKHAEQVGASVTSATVPGAYAKFLGKEANPNLEDAHTYFKEVAAVTPNLDFFPYWFNGAHVTAEDFLDKMADIPNFSGIKYTSYDLYTFSRIKTVADDRGSPLIMISGPDEMNLGAAAMGSDGAIGSTYNLMPKMTVQMREAFEAGDMKAAMEMQTRINRVISILMEAFDFHVSGLNVIAAIFVVLNDRGFDVGKPPKLYRSREFTDEEGAAMVARIKALPFPVE